MTKTEGYENSELFMSLTPKNGVKASKLYSYKPTNGNGDFVWARNLPAYRVNQSGVLELMGSDVPRIDYSNTCPELLIEKTITNELLWSEKFDEFPEWLFDGVSLTSGITAPNNDTTAFKLVEDAFLMEHYYYQNFSYGGVATVTFSVFAQKDERDIIYLQFLDAGGSPYITWFDLTNGTVLTNNNTRADIKLINGYYRCEITNTLDFNGGSSSATFGLAENDGSKAYLGDGTSGANFWGSQLEENDYATSYIPTTTTAVTRPQDICYNTANLFGDAAWSVVMRVRLNNIGSNTSEPLLALNDGSTDNYFCIYTDSNPKLYFDWYNNPDQLTLDTSDLTNEIYNIGVSYDDSTGDYIIVLNGNLEFTGNVGVSLAGAFTGSFLRMDLGSIVGTGSPDGDRIIGVQYYNTALTQSDLENITS